MVNPGSPELLREDDHDGVRLGDHAVLAGHDQEADVVERVSGDEEEQGDGHGGGSVARGG